MKRARTSGGSVTGGTGDIKPQILTLDSGTLGGLSDYVVNRIALPVPRFGNMKTKAIIFEILYVDWYMGIEDLADHENTKFAFLTTSTTRQGGDTASFGSGATDVTDPKTFAFVLRDQTLETSGAGEVKMPIRINLTDDNGNGHLVATDQLSIVYADVAGSVVSSCVAKVGYRLVNVGIQEYVGIVQSQQG